MFNLSKRIAYYFGDSLYLDIKKTHIKPVKNKSDTNDALGLFARMVKEIDDLKTLNERQGAIIYKITKDIKDLQNKK
jgi:hypothetical protein